jgi:hypothetical protein
MREFIDSNYWLFYGADMLFRWVAYTVFAVLLFVIARRLRPRRHIPSPYTGGILCINNAAGGKEYHKIILRKSV